MTAQRVYDTIMANGWGGYTYDQIYALWWGTYNHIPPPPPANPSPFTSLMDLATFIASLY